MILSRNFRDPDMRLTASTQRVGVQVAVSAFRRWALVGACAVILVAIWGTGVARSADEGKKIPFGVTHAQRVKVACFSRGTLRYAGKVKPPGSCEVGGLVESAIDLYYAPKIKHLKIEGSFARIPMTGQVHEKKRYPIEWFNWGAWRSFGFGANERNGGGFILHLYRRVRCDDGSAWYSRADAFYEETAISYFLKLPVCGRSVMSGSLGTRRS